MAWRPWDHTSQIRLNGLAKDLDRESRSGECFDMDKVVFVRTNSGWRQRNICTNIDCGGALRGLVLIPHCFYLHLVCEVDILHGKYYLASFCCIKLFFFSLSSVSSGQKFCQWQVSCVMYSLYQESPYAEIFPMLANIMLKLLVKLHSQSTFQIRLSLVYTWRDGGDQKACENLPSYRRLEMSVPRRQKARQYKRFNMIFARIRCI